mmetsp:Transcript_31147/g.88322  ORF Transcript_31147/g.88322 Transcript_31147/m.88322 type:complete len:286 (-) Transcript_31147:154-1011(-)
MWCVPGMGANLACRQGVHAKPLRPVWAQDGVGRASHGVFRNPSPGREEAGKHLWASTGLALAGDNCASDGHVAACACLQCCHVWCNGLQLLTVNAGAIKNHQKVPNMCLPPDVGDWQAPNEALDHMASLRSKLRRGEISGWQRWEPHLHHGAVCLPIDGQLLDKQAAAQRLKLQLRGGVALLEEQSGGGCQGGMPTQGDLYLGSEPSQAEAAGDAEVFSWAITQLQECRLGQVVLSCDLLHCLAWQALPFWHQADCSRVSGEPYPCERIDLIEGELGGQAHVGPQ